MAGDGLARCREPRPSTAQRMEQGVGGVDERVYCGRREIENRIKELHEGLAIDRTSCSKFWANQFRARAQGGTLRERVLKLGAHVVVSVRRVVIRLPISFLFLASFRPTALSFGALSGQPTSPTTNALNNSLKRTGPVNVSPNSARSRGRGERAKEIAPGEGPLSRA